MASSRTLPDPAACEASTVLPSLVPFEELDVACPAPKPATACALSDNGTNVDAQSNDAQVIVRSDVSIRAPRPVRAWTGIMPDELAETGDQFLLGYDSAPSKPFQPGAVQYSAAAVEWVWTSVSGWNLTTSSNPSDWPWPNFDELADQQILERQVFEAQLQGSLSSLDLPNTFTGDVPAYPYAVARVARINSFRGVQDKLQGVVASTEDASSVVDDIARWAYWLDDDHKPLQLERLRNECRILARVIWGPKARCKSSLRALAHGVDVV